MIVLSIVFGEKGYHLFMYKCASVFDEKHVIEAFGTKIELFFFVIGLRIINFWGTHAKKLLLSSLV